MKTITKREEKIMNYAELALLSNTQMRTCDRFRDGIILGRHLKDRDEERTHLYELKGYLTALYDLGMLSSEGVENITAWFTRAEQCERG